MVNLKPASDREQENTNVEYHRLRRKHLLTLVLISVLIHGLGLFLFGKLPRVKSDGGSKFKPQPIDFVVVPPVEPKKKKPPAPKPEKAAEVKPTPQPEPEIAPETVTPPKPAAPRQPEVTKAVEPPPILSGSDKTKIATPEPQVVTPEKKTQPKSEPEQIPEPVKKEPVATRLPPSDPPQESIAPQSPADSTENTDQVATGSGAASLLGGDYQKTYSQNGAEAFFSPEALAYEAVLNPEQLKALKGFDLEGYQRRMYEKVKRNWQPSFRKKYTTWLTFNIEKNGQISQLRVVESSGSEEFDRVAVEAVNNAAPLEPLPSDFPLEHLEFKYQFYLY